MGFKRCDSCQGTGKVPGQEEQEDGTIKIVPVDCGPCSGGGWIIEK